MTKEKIIELIKQRIEDTKKEFKRQETLYNTSKKYSPPDYTWYDTRIKTFRESLELIGMLDSLNNS